MNTYSLTQTQIGIYLSEQSASEDVNYNIDRLYHLDRSIDPQRLEKALKAVIDNHPGIKSRLVTSADGDILFESHAEEAAVVDHYGSEKEMTAALMRRFDLFNERLYRLGLCDGGDGTILGISFSVGLIN